MSKATTKKTTETASKTESDRMLAAYEASQKFISTSLTMGWQLAVTVLVPVFIGSRLDEHFNTSPRYTVIALLLGILMGVLVVARIIRQVSAPETKGGKK